MKEWVCAGKTTKKAKSEAFVDVDGHPAYTRYPFLKMKHYANRQEFFAWRPIRLYNNEWVWFTKVVKTTYSTRKSVVPERWNILRTKGHEGLVYKHNTIYETPDQIAQRILSNENRTRH